MEVTEALLIGLILLVIYKILDRVIRIPLVGSLDSRYILITGCDTGFGNATAKKLDAMGCHVFAGCLTEAGETDLKKSCSNRMKPINMNVSDPDSVRKAFQQVKQALPAGKGLWGVLNNAGIMGTPGQADWMTIDDYKKTLNVNTFGLIDTTITFLPLVKTEQGRVVNTASVFGRFALPGAVPYTMSKYAVESFSDCLRREMKIYKVSVHIIEPGFHKTNITDTGNIAKGLEKTFKALPKEKQEEYGEEFWEKAAHVTVKDFVDMVVTKDITGVVNAYTHALLGRFPRGRYMMGTDALLVFWPVTLMPEWMGDLLLTSAADVPVPKVLQK